MFDSTGGPWWDERVLKTNSSASVLIPASGPREAEARVMELVRESLPSGPADLGVSVRVIVPSRSLRRHLLRILANRFGAVVGVVVQTHHAAAFEVVERAGLSVPQGGARLQDLLARRFAASEPLLRQELSAFDDGYLPVAAAVRDLLDAGLETASFEAVEEAVQAASGSGPQRAAAVVRTAARCAAALEAMDMAQRGSLHRLAAAVLGERGSEVLPSKAVIIHGFAEATGLLSDFLENLVRRLGARVVIDHPPDPSRADRPDAGSTFTDRLADRLAGPGGGRSPFAIGAGALRPAVSAFVAPGPEAEVREVAERIRALLEKGIDPEDIGVVFRGFDRAKVVAVRRHFRRLGIPFSGEGVQAPGGHEWRRARALTEVLGEQGESKVESWLNARSGLASLGRRELDLALRTVGAARLAQVAALEVRAKVGADGLQLPVVDRADDEGEGAKRRRLFPRSELEKAENSAAALVEVLEKRPERGRVSHFFAWIAEVLSLLGEAGEDRRVDEISESLQALEAELPADLEVGWRDVAPLVQRTLEHIGSVSLGGQGGGVQVLTVTEARGRTFAVLFLPSLNRGVFPLQGSHDPVFDLEARRAAAQVLPDLPLKERDRPEERYLFAQLMASSPLVVLSWQRVDADGQEKNPSVFIERLRLAEAAVEAGGGTLSREETAPVFPADQAPDVFDRRDSRCVRPKLEHAVVQGMDGRGRIFAEALNGLTGGESGHLLAVLDEWAPEESRQDLGPFYGQVGLRPPASVWVSRLEAVVSCPWKAFLERDLGLEQPPEAALTAHGLSGLLIGSIVHEVLERISVVRGVGARRPVVELKRGESVRVPWPKAAEVRSLTLETAERLASDRGIPGLAPALVEHALVFLERAGRLAWPDGWAEVLGVESTGRTEVRRSGPDGSEVTTAIYFRADRVDVSPEGGGKILLDFKTGEPADRAVGTAVARGRLLQGVAYALGGGPDAVGRYVVLKEPEKLSRPAVVDVDPTAAAGAIGPLHVVFGAWDEGWFLPLLETPSGAEGETCRWCTMKAACLHGESGLRRRLAAALADRGPEDPVRRLWSLSTASVKTWSAP